MQAALAEPLNLTDWIRNAVSFESRADRFVARDAASARRRILEVSNGRCQFDVADADSFLQFREAHSYVGRLAVKFFSWNFAAACETSVFRTANHHVALYIPLAGEFHARQDCDWVAVNPGEMLVVSMPGLIQRRWSGPSDLLDLMVGRDALLDAFGPAADSVGRSPLTRIDLRRETTLAKFMENLVRDLGQENSAFGEPALRPHVERLLLLLLAQSMRPSRGALVQRREASIAPYYVRRAETHIVNRFAENLTLAELSRASGVSIRTLYYGFEKYRDQSPMEFLRATRLRYARRRLLEGRTHGAKIAEIAALSGYCNPSQFARDYKKQFGETPTDTLRAPLG
jgi:AraC-like DNA-binding protein